MVGFFFCVVMFEIFFLWSMSLLAVYQAYRALQPRASQRNLCPGHWEWWKVIGWVNKTMSCSCFAHVFGLWLMIWLQSFHRCKRCTTSKPKGQSTSVWATQRRFRITSSVTRRGVGFGMSSTVFEFIGGPKTSYLHWCFPYLFLKDTVLVLES